LAYTLPLTVWVYLHSSFTVFLLVCHINRCSILHRFRDIAGFYARDPTPIPP